MTPFFIALQFLTRLKIVNQTEWSVEDFGKSVVKEMNIFRILWRIQAFSLLEIMMRQLIVLQIIINLSQS